MTPFTKDLKEMPEAENKLMDSFAKVERAKQEWESTVDALPELICVVDDNGRITRANRTIETWGLGKLMNVQGLDFHSLVHPDCTQPCSLDSFIKETKLKATKENIIESEIYDSLLQRFIQMRGKPVSFKKQTSGSHWVIILQDISERKQMEEALHRQNGRLTAINAINQTILTARSPENIAQATLTHLQSLIPFQQAHIFLNLPQTYDLRVLATTENEIDHFLKPGQELTQSEIIGQDNNKLNHYFIVEKISDLVNPTPVEQRWQEQKIHSYLNIPLVMGKYQIGALQIATQTHESFKPEHITIIREVAESLTIAINQSQLYQKLERGNKELQELVRAKHEMIQNVSHDLRSPLALIKGYTELLQDGLFGDLTEEQHEALAVLETKGDQMFFLINRLFQLQTIDKNALSLKAVNSKRFLEDVANGWQVLTDNKSIRLQLEIPENLPLMVGDTNMLNQVVSNLLDNALKFSHEGTTITLRAQEQAKHIILTVSDEGDGIPSEDIEQIFDRFYQRDQGSVKAQNGAGIGLALCKKIMEAHDGRIWAKSAGTGQGSTFFISLPIANEL